MATCAFLHLLFEKDSSLKTEPMSSIYFKTQTLTNS